MFDRLISRFNHDYVHSVISGYVLVFAHAASSFLLIPMYLKCLGLHGFGVFMLLYSFINYSNFGISFVSGGLLRIFSEGFSARDDGLLANAYAVSKLVYVIYSLAACLALVIYVLAVKSPGFLFAPGEAFSAGRAALIILSASAFIVARYVINVEYQILTANKKQFLSNIFQILVQVLYIGLAVLSAVKGGGIAGLMLANFLSVALVRLMIFLYRRRRRDYAAAPISGREMKAIIKRLLGTMGLGYLIYGALIATLCSDVFILGTAAGEKAAEAVANFTVTWKAAELGLLLIWKIPESLLPYIMRLDARKQYDRLAAIYRLIDRLVIALSLLAALGFAFLGKPLIYFWLNLAGNAQIPVIGDWQIWLAAGAVFWMSIARLPSIFAYSTLRLKPLNIIIGLEVGFKILFIALTFGVLQELAPVAAINAVHLAGIAVAYRFLGRKTVTPPVEPGLVTAGIRD